MTTLLPSHALLRLFATRGQLTPRSIIQISRSTCSASGTSGNCASLTSRSSSSLSISSQQRVTTSAYGLLASLTYSTVYYTATTATTEISMALCDSNNNDSNKNNNDDEDFITKIKSKIDSQSFPDLQNNDTLQMVATALGSQISTAISSGIPIDLSYGFFAGYFSGLALKKIGKVASVTLGMSFLALQTLAYHGYIDVHHEKLQKEVEEMLDRNNDGVVDGEDLKMVLHEIKKVAGFGLEDNNKNLLASGGGFGMGFLGGLRSG